MYVSLYAYLSVFLSVCMCVCPSVLPLVRLSVCLFVCLSVCLSVCFIPPHSPTCISSLPTHLVLLALVALQSALLACKSNARSMSLDLYAQWEALEKPDGQFRWAGAGNGWGSRGYQHDTSYWMDEKILHRLAIIAPAFACINPCLSDPFTDLLNHPLRVVPSLPPSRSSWPPSTPLQPPPGSPLPPTP